MISLRPKLEFWPIISNIHAKYWHGGGGPAVVGRWVDLSYNHCCFDSIIL